MRSSQSSFDSESLLPGSESRSSIRSSPSLTITPYIRKKRSKRKDSWQFETDTSEYSDRSGVVASPSESHDPSQGANPVFGSLSPRIDPNEYSVSSGLLSLPEASINERETDINNRLLDNSPFMRNPLKEAEMRRLQDIIQVLTKTMVSRDDCETILKTNVVASRLSYYQLEKYAKERCGMTARSVRMCPDGHMAQAGRFKETISCQTRDCGKDFSDHYKYWLSLPSEQLRAMCFERGSFRELQKGFQRAKEAICREQVADSVLHDFYDGSLFRDNFKNIMSNADPSEEITIFLTMSTDGVELFKGRDGECNCWPVMLTILNMGVEHRFRSANSLLTSFIPGSHDGDHFDTFLYPLVEDLLLLQDGIPVVCADGKVRLMRAFVLFCTADWPGATKLSGFAGHNALRPCRLCLRQTTNRVLSPNASVKMMRKAIEGGANSIQLLEVECPDIRTEQDIKNVWDMLDNTGGSKARTHGRSKSAIMKSTGIKRRPVLSMLSLKFPDAFPYDCMHLLLQGWVKLLITLLWGIHPKTVVLKSPFVLGSDSLSRMNNALQHSSRGFPAAWGRSPPSIETFASYKAETFKTFGLFHGPALFSAGINGRVSELWAATRDILFIAFDPTPSLNDVGYLSELVQRAHALFTMVFRVNNSHNFCFTPTTHAILHLPDVIRKCGPLMNTSQFLPERVMGEVKRQAQSRVLPEANLFHKSQMLFGMRMFGGGLRYLSHSTEMSRNASSDSTHGNEDASIQSHRWQMLGRGEIISSEVVKRRIWSFLRGHGFHERAGSLSVYEHDSAKVTINGIMLHIETAKAFREREKSSCREKAQCRQKCWIAAEFVSSDASSEGAEELTEVYYGKVSKIWNVLIRSSDSNHLFQFAEIEWQNGMYIDSKAGTVYTKLRDRGRKGTIRDITTSFEMISCIKRLVAFLDYGERRYFFDTYSLRMLKNSNSELRGIMER